ncbi:hypothetical protein [Paenirhodobacter sp.]|uniref:hypothetical protein n=1 Tax=Paenirhodobacter sp. TaxID=1965326 RepID=UPI003B3C7D87
MFWEDIGEYRTTVQLALVAGLTWGLGVWAGRGRAHSRDGWTYAYFGLPMKLITVAIVAMPTTALLRKGATLFAEPWPVIVAFLAMTAAFWWLFWEIFVTRLRWNADGLELRRLPFRVKYIPFDQLERIVVHPITESISFIGADGTRIWLPYSYRTGMADLNFRLSQELEDRGD